MGTLQFNCRRCILRTYRCIMVVWTTNGEKVSVAAEKAFCKHYCETFSEFCLLLRAPLTFYHADCKHLMLGQDQQGNKDLDWVKDFEVWSAMTFWCYVVQLILGLIGAAIAAAFQYYIGSAITGILTTYLQCHLLWFIVRWRDGACIPCWPCIDIDKKWGPLVIMIIGVFKVIWAVIAIISALGGFQYGVAYGLLYTIGSIIYCVPQIYMGYMAFKIGQQLRSDPTFLPSKVAKMPVKKSKGQPAAPAPQQNAA